jgi:hypothetical protein
LAIVHNAAKHKLRQTPVRPTVSVAWHWYGNGLGVGGVRDDENTRCGIGLRARFITSGNDHGFIVAGSIGRANFYRELAAQAAGGRTVGNNNQP